MERAKQMKVFAACVSADEFVLGIDFVVAGAVAVAGDGVRRVEAADFAQVLEGAVHLLVGDVREGFAILEVFVFVFIQDGEGVFVEDDGKAVVGLLGGDGHDALVNVGFADFDYVAVAKGCESAEAEKVTSFGKGTGLLDLFLVLIAVHIEQFDFLTVLGNWEIVKGQME